MNATLEWEEGITRDQERKDRGAYKAQQSREAWDAGWEAEEKERQNSWGETIGGWMGSGLGMAGKAVGFDEEPNDQFEAVMTDPLDSIASSSSEAFKIMNKNTSYQKTEQKEIKETAKNTKETSDGIAYLGDLFTNATGIGL